MSKVQVKFILGSKCSLCSCNFASIKVNVVSGCPLGFALINYFKINTLESVSESEAKNPFVLFTLFRFSLFIYFVLYFVQQAVNVLFSLI